MISGRRRWRLLRAAICVDDCGGSFPLLGLSFRRRGDSVCLRGFVVPRVLCRSFPLVSCAIVSCHACLVCPGVGDCVFFACQCSYHAPAWRPVRSRRRRRASAEDMPRCLFPILIISSISCDDGGFILIVLGCRLVLPRCSLFSSDTAIVRRTAGVASHPSSVSFSYELGKTARNVISCSITLGCSRASRSSLTTFVSSYRLVGRLVPYHRRGVSSWRVSGLVVLLVSSHRGRSVIRLSCVVAWCLPSSFACRLVHRLALRLVRRLVLRCPCEPDFVACLLVSSDCSSRLVWRGVYSRLVVASRCSSRGAGRLLLLVLSRRWRMVGGSRLVVSGAGVCLPSLPSWDVAMPFSSSVFPLGSSSPVSCSRRHRSCLVPLARFETAGREAERRAACFGIGVLLIMSR